MLSKEIIKTQENMEAICLEYVEGEKLDHLVFKKTMKKEQIISIVKQIFQIITKASDLYMELMFLELKNIIITPNCEVKLVDLNVFEKKDFGYSLNKALKLIKTIFEAQLKNIQKSDIYEIRYNYMKLFNETYSKLQTNETREVYEINYNQANIENLFTTYL